MNERLRILILTANPVNTPRLKLEDEHRLLRNKMHDNVEVGSCEILVEMATRLTEVKRALKTYQPHIVHFAGHGNADGICLEDNDGANLPLSKEQLSELFNSASGHLRLVVLNACYSTAQMERLKPLVDYIVGTKSPVADDAAVCFAADFYQGLAVGDTVREAFHQAQDKLAVGGEKTQADRYQLLVRHGADETKPLLPPFSKNITRTKIETLSTRSLDVANDIRDGTDASLPSDEQLTNEINEHELHIKRAKVEKARFGNRIISTSK